MRTQKAISVRMNTRNIEELKQYRNRNSVINEAVALWLKITKMNDNYMARRLLGELNERQYCEETLIYHHKELPDFLRWPKKNDGLK